LRKERRERDVLGFNAESTKSSATVLLDERITSRKQIGRGDET
jgi:hypothetical protein